MFAWFSPAFPLHDTELSCCLLMFMVIYHERNYRTVRSLNFNMIRDSWVRLEPEYTSFFWLIWMLSLLSDVLLRTHAKLSPNSILSKKIMQKILLFDTWRDFSTQGEKKPLWSDNHLKERNTSFILFDGRCSVEKSWRREIHFLCKTIKSIDIILPREGINMSRWCLFLVLSSHKIFYCLSVYGLTRHFNENTLFQIVFISHLFKSPFSFFGRHGSRVFKNKRS